MQSIKQPLQTICILTYLFLVPFYWNFWRSTFSKKWRYFTCEHLWRVAVSILTPRNKNTEKKQLFHVNLSIDSLVRYGLVRYFLFCYLCSIRQQSNINTVCKQSVINISSSIINDRLNVVLSSLYVCMSEIISLQKVSCTWHG